MGGDRGEPHTHKKTVFGHHFQLVFFFFTAFGTKYES